MKCLVIGGTLFLGRAIVDNATLAGHDVTLFNRGKTNPGLYPDLEHIVGDRDGDLSSLRGYTFDAVIDTSAYFPRQVSAVVDALAGRCEHYTFVSSISVYADHSTPGADETADLAVVEDPSVEELGADYGGFKARCEATLDELLPGRVHHVRAGLIVGPYDDSGRFSYWVRRIAAGGDVLAPEPQAQPVQLIDVRDLAGWIVHAVTENITGRINATGTPGVHTMATMLDTIQRETKSGATLNWVSEQFLVDHDVEPWEQLPLWLSPASMPTHGGLMAYDNSQALRLGLELRPLAETITATLDNLRASDNPTAAKDFGNISPQPGLTPEHERQLLHSWKQAPRSDADGAVDLK